MALTENLTALAVRAAQEDKAIRTLLNGNAADLSALVTTQKGNLVAALNEIAGAIQGAGAAIDDTTASTMSVYSSQRTTQLVAQAVADLVNGAPEALDTLRELSDALSAQDGALDAIETALANRVRVDAAQAFDATQQAQARTNIGAAAAADLGDVNRDFVADFEGNL